MKVAGRALVIAASFVALALVRDGVTASEVPFLVAAGVALFAGFRLSRDRQVADRMFEVLLAGLAGGAVGFYAELIASADDVDLGTIVLTAVVLPAILGGTFAALAPDWSWRWGFILSWGFVVFGLALIPIGTRPLIVMPVGVAASCAGAFAGRFVRSMVAAPMAP